MALVRREFLETEFGQLHVRMAGDITSAKAPLLCLHMAPQSGQDFEAFMILAGQDRLVIAPDYHGYGDSDPIEGEAVTIEAYAKSIWQALDGLNLHEIEILGHHTGSKVAIEMALQSPQKVKNLMCIALSTLTPEQYADRKVSFQPLSEERGVEALSEWWQTLEEYYDAPYDLLVQKYAISVKSGPRFHFGFQASHHYNAVVLEKLKSLKTPLVLINPNDDLRDVTPLAAQYIEDVALIEKPHWLPGFLDVKPEEVLETLNSAFDSLDAVETSLAS